MIDLFSQRDCRYAYRELLQGYTYVEKEDFYIKHFKEADLGFVDGVYKICIDECKEQGLLDKQSKVTFLKKEDLWDQELYEKKEPIFFRYPIIDIDATMGFTNPSHYVAYNLWDLQEMKFKEN